MPKDKRPYHVKAFNSTGVCLVDVVTWHPGRALAPLFPVWPPDPASHKRDLSYFSTLLKEQHGIDVWIDRVDLAPK